MSGLRSYRAGKSAEDAVCRHYERAGARLIETRWRGAAGEIDLILRDGTTLVFVEVKKARDTASAAARISPRQQQRIVEAAMEYLGSIGASLDTDCRFDAALLDAVGHVEIVPNAFS